MKLWMISYEGPIDYDTYDSAVVIAESAESARATHPSGDQEDWAQPRWRASWLPSPEGVEVKYIGEAPEGAIAGVVLASFNAG